ncbi:MerR family transcriptional regulator [Candidatus Bipolaricaulota bacterium]|nr:MerR family transcriptional regulator [Candidatus Bipolaricaulota bacterium]
MAQLPIKTLRYDEIGLLKPAHVDEAPGYLYYTADQLHQVHRIIALPDLGFPLKQISQLFLPGGPHAPSGRAPLPNRESPKEAGPGEVAPAGVGGRKEGNYEC